MGTSFSNIQVLARGASFDRLIAALRHDAGDVEEVSNDDDADRVVIVLPANDAGWVTIYDEAIELDELARERLAVLASRTVENHAVEITMHDSGFVSFSLFSEGRHLERREWSSLREGRVGSSHDESERRESPWLSLVDEDALAAFDAAIEADVVAAECVMDNVSKLVGWTTAVALKGYTYARKDGERLPEGSVTLRFRDKVRPADETPCEGPPRFLRDAHCETAGKLAVGETLFWRFGWANKGGPGTGVAVVCWGDPLLEGLIALDRFEIRLEGSREKLVLTPTVDLGGSIAHLVFGNAPTALIGGACVGEPSLIRGMRSLIKAQHRGRVEVVVVGRALVAGSGRISCGLAPLENREGADAHQFGVSIRASPRT